MGRNLPNVSQEIKEHIESQIRRSPAVNIRASIIGDPCDRFIYHSIADWEMAKPITVETQSLFELGRHLEEKGKEYLKRVGYQVREQVDYFHWKEKHISGRADCFIDNREKIRQEGEEIIKNAPVEIKWLAEYGDKMETIWDMLNSGRRWIKRYPAQLITYMLLKDIDIGLFLCYGKLSGMPHHIWFDFDEPGVIEYGEELLQKAERVWECIEEKAPAERIDPKEGLCFDCDFLTICEPDMYFGKEAVMMEDERLVKLLDRMNELAPLSSEYEKIKKDLKRVFDGVESAVAGPYIISGRLIEVGPKKAQEASSYWKWQAKKIQPLSKEEGEKGQMPTGF